MDIKNFIENHLPKMDSPEKVYELFNKLGYKTLDIRYKGKKAWGLREKDKDLVDEIYTIANYSRQFQIYLVKLKTFSSHIVRELPLLFERETQYPFFVLTPDYQIFTFVLVEKIREDVGVWKRKLIKLNIDRTSAFYTDKWILSELAIADNIEDPLQIYGLLKKAFGVQKVTKKFFAEYKTTFDFLSNSLKANNKGLKLFYDQEKLYAFTQRFLGRLMFLYFLQKKGWLAGDKKFIPTWFSKSRQLKENFYQSVLEPLFFETLNQKRPNNESKFGKIPFLNGGLFEKDYSDFIHLPDETIEKILNFLNSYNFTISEELPLEVEVAVNPEMLGRIFESMLPEYERGKKGTFYTPRPIVHYMCRESLKDFLCNNYEVMKYKIVALVEKTEIKSLSDKEAKILYETLTNVRILDPAVGSGAFLVGMMQEIIRLKIPLGEKLNIKISQAELKRNIIKSNLYGIDIETEAIEIAKLRLWLSLVVDEDLNKVEPLPNLDYKLVVGNSLVESLGGKKILSKDELQLFEAQTINELQKLRDELLDEMNPNKKNIIRKKIEDKENRLIVDRLEKDWENQLKSANAIKERFQWGRIPMPKSEMKKVKKYTKEANETGKLLEDVKETGFKPFFLPLIHFAEVIKKNQGFDIVIANPPYVKVQKLSDISYRKDLDIHYHFKDDMYVYFTFRAFELARPKGVIAFITSDTYLTLSWKERMRELLQKHHIQRLILTPKAFKATVNTAIYIARKEILSDYNLTFIDAREVGGDEDEYWEDKLLIFEGLNEIESYDTQTPVRLGKKEVEVSYNRYADVGQFRVPLELYKSTVKQVFFTPTRKNLRLYEKFMPKLNKLYESWWSKIKSSKDIQKNKEEIKQYVSKIKPGDITILGLITDGGVGLQTGDNGRFLAVLENTDEAQRIENKIGELERIWEKKTPEIYNYYKNLLRKHSRNEALDMLKVKYGKKLHLPWGFMYKTIKAEDIFSIETFLKEINVKHKEHLRRVIIYLGIPNSEKDVKNLWNAKKLPNDLKNLSSSEKNELQRSYASLTSYGNWVAYEKGDKEGAQWWHPVTYYIEWSTTNVQWLFSNSGRKGKNMPVVRNPEYYFTKGFSWNKILNPNAEYIKCRIKNIGVNDVGGMSLCLLQDGVLSLKYIIALINSLPVFHYFREFISCGSNIELNDLRNIPVVVPTESQRNEIDNLVDCATDMQKRHHNEYDGGKSTIFLQELGNIQSKIDTKIKEIYNIE